MSALRIRSYERYFTQAAKLASGPAVPEVCHYLVNEEHGLTFRFAVRNDEVLVSRMSGRVVLKSFWKTKEDARAYWSQLVKCGYRKW